MAICQGLIEFINNICYYNFVAYKKLTPLFVALLVLAIVIGEYSFLKKPAAGINCEKENLNHLDECCELWAEQNSAVIPKCNGTWNVSDGKCIWECLKTIPLIGGCGAVHPKDTNECCEKFYYENKLVKPSCEGIWIVKEDVCTWDCDVLESQQTNLRFYLNGTYNDISLSETNMSERGIISYKWIGQKLIIETYISVYCSGVEIVNPNYEIINKTDIILRYKLYSENANKNCKSTLRGIYEISGIERTYYKMYIEEVE